MDLLDRCLGATMDWMRGNKLKLNPDKTEMLLVGGSADQMEGVRPVLEGAHSPDEASSSLGGSLGVVFVTGSSGGLSGMECLLPASADGPATPLPGQR